MRMSRLMNEPRERMVVGTLILKLEKTELPKLAFR